MKAIEKLDVVLQAILANHEEKPRILEHTAQIKQAFSALLKDPKVLEEYARFKTVDSELTFEAGDLTWEKEFVDWLADKLEGREG